MSSLRIALRRLLKQPGFALPIVGALALAIGATTSIFSVFSAMLLSPNGFTDPAQVVALWATDPAHGQTHVETSYRDWEDWRSATGTLRSAALVSSVNLDFTISSGGDPFVVDGATVSGSFFAVAGTRPFAGRLLNEADDQPGAPLRAVLSHRLWKSRFNSDPGIIGSTVRSGNDSVTVIGIAPPEFDFPRDAGMWIALRASWPNLTESRDVRVFRGLARLQPGVTPQVATARLTQLAGRSLASQPSGTARLGISATSIHDEMLGSARAAIEILLAAVLLVLLIACANAANLLLANANARSGELAVRVALGAGRRRVARLLFAETICLGSASGILGMALAVFGTRIIARFAPADIPAVASAQIDYPILGFGLLLTFATILAFGLGPAWLASRRDPNEVLKSTGHRASGTAAQMSLRRLLIVSEVAFAAFLLVGAGLLVRSYRKLAAVDPGFSTEGILTFRVTTEKPDQPSRQILYTRILDGLRRLPGVESAAAVLIRPLSGTVGWDTNYAVQGQSEIESRNNPNGNYEAISPGYFRTMGIRLIRGRDFTDADRATSAPVVIVNETTARRHWPGGNAIGKQIRLGSGPRAQSATVAGVVRDVRYREWEAARPDFYVPLLQRAQHRTDFVVKTRVPPADVAEAARRLVLSIDSSQPISNVTTMAALADNAIARSRFNGVMLGSLAICAVLLAAFGIYSLLSYVVSQSAFEIALRTALGATPADVAVLITGRGVVLVAAGAVIGLGAALAANRFLRSLLYEISPADPVAYFAAFGALILIALAASARPAVRAAAIDPMQTLRSGG